MGQVIKTFLGIFLLMLLLLLGCGIIGAQMESVAARNYHSAVVTELSDSGCDQSVIESCRYQAEQDGYQLKVQVCEQAGGRMAEVTLGYEYRIPMLRFHKIYQLRGYAI